MPTSGNWNNNIDGEWSSEARAIPSGDLIASYSGTEPISFDTGRWSGVNLPKFYARMRAGELLPHTSWLRFAQTGSITAGTIASHNKEGTARTNWLEGLRANHSPLPSEGEVASVADAIDAHYLVQACAADVYSRGHDTLTFLAELHKTYALVANGLKSIINLCTGRSPAQSWLEYRYGWRILYYDIVEIKKVLSEMEDERKRVSHRIGTSTSGSNSSTETHYIGGGMYYDIITDDSWTISARGMISADFSASAFQFNPAITAWELITYSFIIDWFVSIGQWLAGLSFLALASNHTSSVGYKITYNRELTGSNYTDSETHYNDCQPYSASSESEYLLRVPTPVSTLPLAKINLDFSKILDLIAILWTIISGSKPNPGVRK